ncbi:MAG: hypothetical protein HC896_10815 [Bacteroidales bacterium]|nr:hypothetical protein [Bacteroidales bacterium]
MSNIAIRYFFIINCNTYAFNVLKYLFPIEDNSLAIISCEPFNAKELQQLILSRHKSSGLNLNYKGKPEANISQLNYSVLFNAYFNFTRGIPGIAMNTWKANIIKSGQDSISIKIPARPNAAMLDHLQEEWLIAIALFIQHKNIDAQKMSRLINCGAEAAQRLLLTLKNAGILVNKTESTYTLGRNIEPFLVELCLTKGII